LGWSLPEIVLAALSKPLDVHPFSVLMWVSIVVYDLRNGRIPQTFVCNTTWISENDRILMSPATIHGEHGSNRFKSVCSPQHRVPNIDRTLCLVRFWFDIIGSEPNRSITNCESVSTLWTSLMWHVICAKYWRFPWYQQSQLLRLFQTFGGIQTVRWPWALGWCFNEMLLRHSKKPIRSLENLVTTRRLSSFLIATTNLWRHNPNHCRKKMTRKWCGGAVHNVPSDYEAPRDLNSLGNYSQSPFNGSQMD
jgi:hypothetical protein